MFASVDDVLLAVQAAIRDDLWPETSSPWAERQARTALWALEHVRVRLARGRELLLTEHQQLSALAASVEDARATAMSALVTVGPPTLSGRPAAELLDAELEAEVSALARMAEQLAEISPDLEGAMLQQLRTQLMRYVVDHDRRLDSVIDLDYTC